jgi:hypothetical protein
MKKNILFQLLGSLIWKLKYPPPNLEEAITKALKEFLSIPDENYLEDSFDVDLQNLEEEYPNEDFNMDIVYSKL